jgi:hypothetical protein
LNEILGPGFNSPHLQTVYKLTPPRGYGWVTLRSIFENRSLGAVFLSLGDIYTHMAPLLKELTLRYSPKSTSFSSVAADYYAMFNSWRTLGSGGHPGASSQRKTEIIDDLFEQVWTQFDKQLSDYLSSTWSQYRPIYKKPIEKLRHARAVREPLDYHAAASEILTGILGHRWMRPHVNPDIDQQQFRNLSPIVQRFVQKPHQPEKTNSPATSKVSQGQAPAQMAKPEEPSKPAEKLPLPAADLPPMEKPFATNAPKRLGGNWENILKDFGYDWNEDTDSYRNDKRGVRVQILGLRNSAEVTYAGGKKKTFATIGELLRAMGHARRRRHATVKVGQEPAAQVTNEDYKLLYEFLYT